MQTFSDNDCICLWIVIGLYGYAYMCVYLLCSMIMLCYECSCAHINIPGQLSVEVHIY